MQAALEEAKAAGKRDEVPIGAILVNNDTGEIVARAGNRTIELSDPTAHAEILVIRERCAQLGVQRIPGHTLYVTLEPCTMCAAALGFARINRIVFAATDEKGGGILHGAKFYEQATCHHRPEIDHGTLEEESRTLLNNFFKEYRKK